MLAQARELMEKARAGVYALGAFNTINLEVTQAIIRAANEKRSPVVVQVSETTIAYAGLKSITQIVCTVAEEEGKDVPIALHLDHGRSFHSIAACIKAGFSSVQIDASDLGFEENINLTRQVVDFAHSKDVFVQGELGRVGGMHGVLKKNGKKIERIDYTDPLQVKEFVNRTGIDSLAVSIGTVHGLYKAKMRFDILEEIRSLVPVPLVLHGASGVLPKEVRKAIRSGINKINIDTELRVAFFEALRKFLGKNKEEADPRKILGSVREAIQEIVAIKVELFGSAEKANP